MTKTKVAQHKMRCGFNCRFTIIGGSNKDAWKYLDRHNKIQHGLITILKENANN